MNIFSRGDLIRLTKAQRILLVSACNSALTQWLASLAEEMKETKAQNHQNRVDNLLQMIGEAKALAILLEPEPVEEQQS
jgi:hypothetical protein